MQASKLIADAYYLSGIVGREFADVTTTETIDGLQWLNEILSEKSINGSLIPYYTHYEFTTVAGDSIYEVPSLIEITAMTFNLNNVRFSMIRDTVNNFFGNDRVDDVQSLPFHYYAERQTDGMTIYLYFVPVQPFLMKITGNFAFAKIPNVNTTLTYNDFYFKYLKYELANAISDQYNIPLPDSVKTTLNNLRRSLRDLSGVDLSLETRSCFPGWPQYDQSDARISRGWRP